MKNKHALFCLVFLAFMWTESPAADWQRADGSIDGEIRCLIADGTDLYAGTSDSGVFRSIDSAKSWFPVRNGLTSLNIQCLARKGTYLFTGTYDRGVFRSIDSGANWQPLNTGLSSFNVQALGVSDSFVFAGTNGGGVCRSADSGAHWLEVSSGIILKNVFSIGITSDYVFVGTWGGSAFRTADNGLNWFLVTNGLPHPRENIIPYCFAMIDTFIFAGTGGGGVFRAKDSARAWYLSNNGLFDSASIRALIHGGHSLFAATQKGVFCSMDNGDTWIEGNAGLTDTLVRSFAISGTTLFAGTQNGVWKSSITEPPVSVGAQAGTCETGVMLEQNSPNPFTTFTLLRYQNPVKGFVSLKVYDTRGRQVAVLVNSLQSAGIHSMRYDASGLAPGLYLTRLKTNRSGTTKIMLRIR